MTSLLLYLTGWTELTVAIDPQVYDCVCRALSAENVPCRTRAHYSGNRTARSTFWAPWGSGPSTRSSIIFL